jgi:threonine synthase
MRWAEAGVFPEVLAAHLAAALGADWTESPCEWHERLGCLLLRDDLTAHGTHKARGVGVQLARGLAEPVRGVALSSSGNAGIAAARWCARLGVPCFVFVSDRTDPAKIAVAAAAGADVVVTSKPKNLSRHAARYGHLLDLRGSRSEDGALGYRLLAAELARHRPTSIFTFCNSGLTLIGLAEGLRALRECGRAVDWAPQLHAIVCSPDSALPEALDVAPRPEAEPVAGPLGLQTSPRLDELATALRSSGGSAWPVRNAEVLEADALLRGEGIDIAIESAAALAGRRRAEALGWPVGERPLVLVAAPCWPGTDPANPDLAAAARVHALESYAEVMALLDQRGLGRSTQAAE